MKPPRALLVCAVVAATSVAGCASSSPAVRPGAAPSVAETRSPAPVLLAPSVDVGTPVVARPAAPAEPSADAYSQVVDGVLHQGTEIAPVRIGTDVPGQPPAAEAGWLAAEGWEQYAEDNDKYVVTVFQGDDGWLWKVFGLSRHGSFREVGNNRDSGVTRLPTRDAAAAGPFEVDGRGLDRAEFILHVN